MNVVRRVFMLMLVLGCALAVGIPSARADEKSVDRLEVTANLAADGTLKVSQQLTFSGQMLAKIVQRLAMQREAFNNSEYEFTYSDIAASAGGADLSAQVGTDGRHGQGGGQARHHRLHGQRRCYERSSGQPLAGLAPAAGPIG